VQFIRQRQKIKKKCTKEPTVIVRSLTIKGRGVHSSTTCEKGGRLALMHGQEEKTLSHSVPGRKKKAAPDEEELHKNGHESKGGPPVESQHTEPSKKNGETADT